MAMSDAQREVPYEVLAGVVNLLAGVDRLAAQVDELRQQNAVFRASMGMGDGTGNTEGLVAFLRARLDEDEQAARAAVGFDYGVREWADDGDPVNVHIARHDPARVLREVEAKRRMLDWFARIRDWATDNNLWTYDEVEPLKLMALPYADHPEYRKEWRP